MPMVAEYEVAGFEVSTEEPAFFARREARDVAVRARLQARVLRFETGNLGDHKSVGSGIWEARMMFGPGYRIYFGKDGDSIIVLLIAGDKGSQSRDVSLAQGFWRDYLEAKRHGKAK